MKKLYTSQSFKNQKYVDIVRDTVRLLTSLKDVHMSSTMFKDAYNGALHELSVASKALLTSYGYCLQDGYQSPAYIVDMRSGKRVEFEHPETYSEYWNENGEYRLLQRHIGENIAIYFVCQSLELEIDLKG